MLENRSVSITASSTSRTSSAELPSRQRAKRTNDPFAGIDLNTARGRRVADLVRAFLLALENPAGIEQQAAVIAAAELQVLAEEARAIALKRSGHADLDQVIRVQGAADRAVRRLGIKAGKASTLGPTLAEYLSAKSKAEPEDGGEPDPTEVAPAGGPADSDANDDEADA
jgi:hypothetical protein